MAGGYVHAKQFRRLQRTLKRQRIILGFVIREAQQVECIGKGKARKPYEFCVKSAVAVSHEHGLMLGARTFPGDPYDGHILSPYWSWPPT